MNPLKYASQLELFKAKERRHLRFSNMPKIKKGRTGKEETDEFDPKQENIYQQIIAGTQKFFQKNEFAKGVIGLSGGIDSSLTLKLCVDALGKDHVVGLILPELSVTARENIDHAKKLAEFFGIEYFYQQINPFMMDYYHLAWKPNNLAIMNTKARIRMTLLYNYANSHGATVIGTSNKSELLLGYGTKHGDLAADFEVIGDLLKTEVFELARYAGLPEEIIKKTPSAELTSGQTDEGDLGMTYRELDQILHFAEEGQEKAAEKGLSIPLIHKIFALIEKNEHKRKMPQVIKIRR